MAKLFWHLGKASMGSAIVTSGIMKISFIFILSNSMKMEDVVVLGFFIFLGICLFLSGVKGLNNLKA